jgi:hypothetical protein
MQPAFSSTMQALAQNLPARTRLVLLVFVFCCLLSSARLVTEAPIPGRSAPDDIAQRSDLRFAQLKAALPQRGVIGYVGDTGESDVAPYYLAQYALAPLVLDRSPNHPFVVGNFHSSPPASSPEKLRLIANFGNGVLLFAGQDQP